jgi:helicase required for RNAi-mediated heterochromatin assembly 1
MSIKVKVVFSGVSPADFEPILREHIAQPYQLHDEHTQAEWRRLPEVPSGREMNPDSLNGATYETLPENVKEGSWGSKEAYIGAQYRLLRYDAIYPLRESIRSYKENSGISDLPTTSIYTNVRYLKINFSARIL